jgi:protein disulfide-isomerase
MLKRNLFLLALLFFIISCGAVDASDWQTDYAKALQMAKAQNKRVLLDFTGSDWCGPCIDLRKRVFSRPEFLKYAEKNLILVEVDFPQRKSQSAELKKQNEKLSGQYGIDRKGFPTIFLLEPSGKVLREFTGYDGESVAELIAWIEGKSNS